MFNSDEMSPKGLRTRANIRAVALESFRERGYDGTTVRLIAQASGVSVGSMNYYFPSKNHLVQELYLDVTKGFYQLATQRMQNSDDLTDRLRIAYETGIETLEPYQEFAPGFLSAAMSPKSPINPLSGESEPALAESIAAFRAAVTGSKQQFPDDIADTLPEALTIAYLLLALFWSYDRSEQQQHTRRLLNGALTLMKMGLPLLKVPGIRKPLRELLQLIS